MELTLKNLVISHLKNVLYFFQPLSRRPRCIASVLMYHSVSESPYFFSVSTRDFVRQIEHIRQNGYSVLTLDEMRKRMLNKEPTEKNIVLTFDDGFSDNYSEVFPVLKKYNIPAVIFLTTGQIGKTVNKRGTEVPMLSWTQIIEMHQSGLVDFQPHTVNHPKLDLVGESEAREEIVKSKMIIEEKLQKQCNFFAYPYGRYNEQTLDILKQGGLQMSLGVKPGLVCDNGNSFDVKRNSIDKAVFFYQFKKILDYGKI